MKSFPKNGILIAFGELFLKSEGVRKLFQKKLIWNLRFFLKEEGINYKIHLFHDRIFIALPAEVPSVREGRRRETEKTQKTAKIIKRIFGISWFSEVLFFSKADLKNISNFVAKNYSKWIKKGETFALRVNLEKGVLKENKDEVIKKIAEKINRKVNLDKPKREIFIEIRKNIWFLYFKKTKGAGGLPVGASGKVLTLMSGGIDSPVAAYLITKRGAENIWLHFHSFPLVSNKSIEKTKELVKIFLKYQPKLKIYFIPFQKAQIEIKAKADAKYRILLYRRLMLRIAEQIAKKENCWALVTGESLGQVSSQTLPNIKIIEETIKIPVLRPLIGQDKEEIIQAAKKMGTFEISIKPQEDCCTLFVPAHATGQGDLEYIKKLEKKLDIKKIIKDIIKEAKVVVK